MLCLSTDTRFPIEGKRVTCRGSKLGTLCKTRRQRQRERHQRKDLMNKTIAVHVRYESWYITLSSSAKQQRETTKSALFGEREPQRLIFRISIWN